MRSPRRYLRDRRYRSLVSAAGLVRRELDEMIERGWTATVEQRGDSAVVILTQTIEAVEEIVVPDGRTATALAHEINRRSREVHDAPDR